MWRRKKKKNEEESFCICRRYKKILNVCFWCPCWSHKNFIAKDVLRRRLVFICGLCGVSFCCFFIRILKANLLFGLNHF